MFFQLAITYCRQHFLMHQPFRLFVLGSYRSGKTTVIDQIIPKVQIPNVVKVQRTKVNWDLDEFQDLSGSIRFENLNRRAMSEAVDTVKQLDGKDAIFEGAFESICYLMDLEPNAYYEAIVSADFAEVVERLRKALVVVLLPHIEFLESNFGDPNNDYQKHLEVTQIIRNIMLDKDIVFHVIDPFDLNSCVQKIIGYIAKERANLIIDR